MRRLSITLGDDRRDTIESRLEYNDDLAQWIREAIDLRLALENDDEMLEDDFGDLHREIEV